MITQLPLDVWQHILGYFEVVDAIAEFEKLWMAKVFQNVSRLDAFWTVIMSAREHTRCNEAPPQDFPDIELVRDNVATLVDMGVSEEHATMIMRESGGDWYCAMRLLGWD